MLSDVLDVMKQHWIATAIVGALVAIVVGHVRKANREADRIRQRQQ